MRKNNMRFIYYLLCVCFVALSSCSKEETSNEFKPEQSERKSDPSEKKEEATFYVKYEMNVNYSNSNHVLYLKFVYTNETGNNSTFTQKIEKRKSYSWEGVYGLFKKSQTVTLDCNSQIGESPRDMYLGVGDYYGRIYVKEGDGEFVIKAEGTSSNTGNIGLIYSKGLHLKCTI